MRGSVSPTEFYLWSVLVRTKKTSKAGGFQCVFEKLGWYEEWCGGFLLCMEGAENEDKEGLQMEQLLPLASKATALLHDLSSHWEGSTPC